MANWYGTARSNYFKVRDLEAFKEEFGDMCRIVERDGMVAVFPDDTTDDGSFPSTRLVVVESGDEETEDYEDFDFVEAVSEHLTEDSIAVFMCAGAEKQRYISGWAVAIDHKGEREELVLRDIHRLAAKRWPYSTVTDCSY